MHPSEAQIRQHVSMWMARVLEANGIDRFDDLHVDEIGSSWSSREHWVDAALRVLNIAVAIRQEKHLEVTPAVGFSLRSVPTANHAHLRDLQAVAAELDVSPPSLYLFHPGREPWTTDRDFAPWAKLRAAAPNLPDVLGYLRTWWEPTERSFQRSLFICLRTSA
jgi:hypothetical protein